MRTRRPARSPLEEGRAWHYPYRLDEARVAEALGLLVGRRKFLGFTPADATTKTGERTLFVARAERRDSLLEITLEGQFRQYQLMHK